MRLMLPVVLLLSTAALAEPRAPFVPGTGLGVFRRATPQSPCAGAPYRQFDFWLGQWAVENPAGAFKATSRILSDLDGCVVAEHYSPTGSPRGRSLNTYDSTTGRWHQTWVPAGGRPIRMDGALRPDGVMALTGTRVPPAPFQDYGWVDAYTWTKVSSDQVVQAFTFDIFKIGFHLQGFLTYRRAAQLPATVPATTTQCQAGGESGETRRLDFTLGHYTVRAENGLALAESEIALDPVLDGCLLEERLTTAKGYQALGWLYYDAVEDRFYRTVVDTEGNRLELQGAVSSGGFSMEGASTSDAGARLRLTWLPQSSGDLLQIWEALRDGAWTPVQTLTYARR